MFLAPFFLSLFVNTIAWRIIDKKFLKKRLKAIAIYAVAVYAGFIINNMIPAFLIPTKAQFKESFGIKVYTLSVAIWCAYFSHFLLPRFFLSRFSSEKLDKKEIYRSVRLSFWVQVVLLLSLFIILIALLNYGYGVNLWLLLT